MIGIYCIRNVIDNKRYIGQSIHVQIWKYEHFESLRKGTHFNPHLQAAYNLYGSDNFIFEILEECPTDKLSDLEIYWISFFGGYTSDNLYNISPGGKSNAGECNPRYGKHWSEDWKSVQSKKMKYYFSIPENHPMYGKHHSQETRLKLSNAHSGRAQPKELNVRRSETMKNHYANGDIVHPMQGKHLSEAHKSKIREKSLLYRHSEDAKKKISAAVSGANNGMYGKHLSEEAKKHLSKTHSGANNHAYGKVRITDGTINKFWPKDDPIPEGFRLGMAPRKKSV